MARKSKEKEDMSFDVSAYEFSRLPRLVVPVPHYELDQTVEIVQGGERTVRQLFEDYVLGRLDMRDLGGNVQYDPDDSSNAGHNLD